MREQNFNGMATDSTDIVRRNAMKVDSTIYFSQIPQIFAEMKKDSKQGLQDTNPLN